MKFSPGILFIDSHQVSEEEWGNIPEAQEHAKHKEKKKDKYSDLPEHMLLGTTGMREPMIDIIMLY